MITMTKKQKRRMQALEQTQQVERQPEPRRYDPPPCSTCAELREGKNYSRVSRTIQQGQKILRYSRCEFCGNSFKQIENN